MSNPSPSNISEFVCENMFWEELEVQFFHIIFALLQRKDCRKDDNCANKLYGQMKDDEYLSWCCYA